MVHYINTIDDMQNEKDFFYHCNMFVNNHDALLAYEVLDSDVYLCEIDYNIFSSIKNLYIAKNIILNFNRVLNSVRFLKLFSRSFTSNNNSV